MLITPECVVDSEQNDFVVAVQLLSYIDTKITSSSLPSMAACVVMLGVFLKCLKVEICKCMKKSASDSACA